MISVALLAIACGDGGRLELLAQAPADARRVNIDVGASGYDPDRIRAAVGEVMTLVFTRSSDEGCGEELVIESVDLKRELPLNQPVEVTLRLKKAGDIRFACGMDMYRGTVVVE